jgi:hypothetical protein
LSEFKFKYIIQDAYIDNRGYTESLLIGVRTARLRDWFFVGGTARHVQLILVTRGTVISVMGRLISTV